MASIVRAVEGQRFPAAYREKKMNIAHWLGVGILVGMTLFFILERSGVVYKWFDKWDSM